MTAGGVRAARMKMKDLERAAGVGRETIRFYIREGLLPEPHRPSRNVAWYDVSFVERLALIKELQQKRFLPLHVIRSIVGAETPPSRDEIRTLLELDGKLFPAVAGAPEPAADRLNDVARRVGIPAREILEFAATGMIEVVPRDGDQWLEEPAIRMVELWAKLREAGFDHHLGFGAASFRVYAEFVRWLAREELRLFTQGVTGRVTPEVSARMAEAGINCMNQMVALLRKATLLRYIAEGNVPTESAETTHVAGAPRSGGRHVRRAPVPSAKRTPRSRSRR
ncbi:MAG: MerR family transcriptional regulator [Deltaproteobacteria bacterium]|nr:MerR family transcriptional regulator [Deltaproteobacteria bacterium]